MPTIATHTIKRHAVRHQSNHQTDYEREHKSTERTGIYGHRWRKMRLLYLRRNPLCVHCKYDEKTTPATEVDHIIPHRGDKALFWDMEGNWMALCKPCHSRKTAHETMNKKA